MIAFLATFSTGIAMNLVGGFAVDRLLMVLCESLVAGGFAYFSTATVRVIADAGNRTSLDRTGTVEPGGYRRGAAHGGVVAGDQRNIARTDSGGGADSAARALRPGPGGQHRGHRARSGDGDGGTGFTGISPPRMLSAA